MAQGYTQTVEYAPWWVKLCMFIVLMGALMCAVCLPLIVLKLYRNDSGFGAKAKSNVFAAVGRDLQPQIESVNRPADVAPLDDDSRFQPR